VHDLCVSSPFVHVCVNVCVPCVLVWSRFAPGSSLTDQGSGGQGSGDFVSQLVDQGETQDIQVLRITAARRFFR
jgi:hypothetical protein